MMHIGLLVAAAVVTQICLSLRPCERKPAEVPHQLVRPPGKWIHPSIRPLMTQCVSGLSTGAVWFGDPRNDWGLRDLRCFESRGRIRRRGGNCLLDIRSEVVVAW